jgi:hypothetical protein
MTFMQANTAAYVIEYQLKFEGLLHSRPMNLTSGFEKPTALGRGRFGKRKNPHKARSSCDL